MHKSTKLKSSIIFLLYYAPGRREKYTLRLPLDLIISRISSGGSLVVAGTKVGDEGRYTCSATNKINQDLNHTVDLVLDGKQTGIKLVFLFDLRNFIY